MYKWFQRSLQNQLIVFILLAVLLPLSILGIFSYSMANHLAKERSTISGQSSLKQLKTSLEFIVNDIDNMSVFLIGNEDVQQYLKSNHKPVQQRWNINGFLSNLTFSKPYIANILIEPLNNNPNISTIPILTTDRDLSDYNLEHHWWSSRYSSRNSIESQQVISMFRPIRSTKDYKLIGYLSIYLDQQVIEEHLESVDFEWNGSTLLMNEGSVIASNDKQLPGSQDIAELYSLVDSNTNEQAITYEYNGNESTIITTTLSGVGWKLIGIIPFKEFTAQNRYFLLLTFISVIIAALLVIGLVLFFVRKVIGPLSSLTTAIQASDPGTDIRQLTSHSSDELGQLIISYNKLNERIRSLMNRIQKNESHKREVDLQALQAQINPHFLYNTLASIHWMALVSREANISKMVSALSSFLRFSLNKGNEYCTVEQELSHLFHYTQIQEIRYPDSFHLDVHIPHEVNQLYMLKLTLQPLIENSIIHGLLPSGDRQGEIKVVAEWDRTFLYLTVSDDGVGMSREKAKQLQEQFLADEKGEVVVGPNYGLRNVNLRLLLHYGSIARLRITSSPNRGTSIKFTIPLESR
ncbi:sensor histidine kinase [Gracilibacillus kekensis]|uniref:histidine kinase n=1 Tax=Gracilibacillus kekensis TaxID=1027249 RepID=A0A1M7QTH2_9BACI|nr:sensor histidine kinase [Gracilibacillus kekensis]SHN34691.1 two-component system, sensor histidine kinase YesM [Gracilibacillus kekensis]